MAVELTIFPTHLLLSQTLLTGSQEIDYNPWLLEMSPVLAVTVWCAHLVSAPLAGTCDESCSWQHRDLPTQRSVHSRLPRKPLGRSHRTLRRSTAQILEERSVKEGGGGYTKLWLDRPKNRKNISPRPLSGDPDD